jgi:FtsZ-binding cell division protein ZapB
MPTIKVTLFATEIRELKEKRKYKKERNDDDNSQHEIYASSQPYIQGLLGILDRNLPQEYQQINEEDEHLKTANDSVKNHIRERNMKSDNASHPKRTYC